MKCPSCGETLIEGAKFCASCGNKVENVAVVQQTQPKKSSNKVLWIVLGIVGGLILLGIIFAVLIFFLAFRTVEKEVKNLPDISDISDIDYDDEEEIAYEKKDPTGHIIKVVENNVYIYEVELDYLYDKASDMMKKAKIATEADIERLNATSTQKEAIKKAITELDNDYLAVTKEEVTSALKEAGYDEATIKYALDHCGADWEERATIEAYQLLSTGGMSKEDLISMLKTSFSEEIANKVVKDNKFDYYEQAVYNACFYRFTEKTFDGSYDREKAKSLLEFHHFTKDEIDFALKFVYDEMKDES